MSSWADSWARSSPRNRIVLATASTDLERRLQEATDGACLSLPLGPPPPNPAAPGHVRAVRATCRVGFVVVPVK